jgi:hypothetical protein
VETSIQFAGSDNFCPVLVGAFAGALYGAHSITSEDLQFCSSGLVLQVMESAAILSKGWE